MTAKNFIDPHNNNDNNKEINAKTKTNGDIEYLDPKTIGTDLNYKHQIVWPNLIGFLILHLLTVWALALVVTGQVTWKSIAWTVLYGWLTSESVTIGAHRLYAHKTFKAHPILKAILIIGFTAAGQNSMFVWCRDHRLHHKFSDTDADPHNAKRGFFFSHIGWLMTKKHPHVIEQGRKTDLRDLQADWMVVYQKKYYFPLYVIFSIVVPVYVAVRFFNEDLLTAFLVCYVGRYILTLNGTWLVNSAAHLYGYRPYDERQQPVENWFVSLISSGEGWHNYHHTFPWDYKAAELHKHFNQTASIIEFFAAIGLASDLRTASSEVVTERIKKWGDGTHKISENTKYINLLS